MKKETGYRWHQFGVMNVLHECPAPLKVLHAKSSSKNNLHILLVLLLVFCVTSRLT